MGERRGFVSRRGEFRERERGDFMPKPVEVGKVYEVEIQEMSRRGEGVARIEGLVIFVPNAKQGEHAKIKVTKVSRRCAEAEVVTESQGEEANKEE